VCLPLILVNNGEELEWEEDLTVSDLLTRLPYTFPIIIVYVNGEMVCREDYSSRTIPDGAAVRAIHLIAGG